MISQPFWPAYLTAERIAKAPKLKLAITAGIGSDHVDLQAAIERGITVAEVTYCNSISVSEHVVMMILALVRNYIPSYQRCRRGLEHRRLRVALLRPGGDAGRHRGAGRIGSAVLRRLKPFEVGLHYTDRHRLPDEVEEELGVTYHPDGRSLVRGLRRGDDQRAASSGDRAPVQRRADRQDEARRLPREHRARQDLRSGRDRAGARKRAARGLRRRRLVPPARPARIIRGGRCRTTA